MLVLCAPAAFAAEIVTGNCGDHVTYTWNKTTGAVTISGNGPMCDYFDPTDTPFYSSGHSSGQVKTVMIENGVTSVGSGAFYCCTAMKSNSTIDF